jgi:hypothetical protein
LHVLSTPPAFVLSQNQTLRKCQTPPQHPKTPRQQTHETGTPPGNRRSTHKVTRPTITAPHTKQGTNNTIDDHTTPTTPHPHPPPTTRDRHQATSSRPNMASTTWHAVEFSKNRRTPQHGPQTRQEATNQTYPTTTPPSTTQQNHGQHPIHDNHTPAPTSTRTQPPHHGRTTPGPATNHQGQRPFLPVGRRRRTLRRRRHGVKARAHDAGHAPLRPRRTPPRAPRRPR